MSSRAAFDWFDRREGCQTIQCWSDTASDTFAHHSRGFTKMLIVLEHPGNHEFRDRTTRLFWEWQIRDETVLQAHTTISLRHKMRILSHQNPVVLAGLQGVIIERGSVEDRLGTGRLPAHDSLRADH